MHKRAFFAIIITLWQEGYDDGRKIFKGKGTGFTGCPTGYFEQHSFGRRTKKYLKNLLLFALMNASGNETVTNRNFIKLVNKLFKKFLIQIIKKAEDDDDDETFEEALDVELNRIVANKEMLDLQTLQSILTPSNIIANIKMNIDGLSQRQVLNKLLSLRDAFVNHRETPEEAREREQRQKEYELQKKRERVLEEYARQRSLER